MGRYTKYKLYQKYETRGSQEAIPCYPNVFSVDGDGTMPLVIVEENSRDCGYTGETQPIYRWYTLPITSYYVCDDCQEAQYQWVNIPIVQDWECVGTTKYYKQKKQISVDGGQTWSDVTPPQYQRGAVYETSSQSCGYRSRTTTGTPYCQGYDKYVDVYTETSSDGGSSWITASTTPTMVEHNSAYCGYIEPQYRTTSGTPYCEGYDKYVDVYSQVSYDGGITWQTTATTPTMVEHNSEYCGYIEPQYRTTSGTPYCEGYDKYVPVYSQVSYDGGVTWETTATTNVLIEAYSQDCGYVPLTRWVESGWTCIGYGKYVNNVEQISYDNGQTWQNTSNTSASTLIEAYSQDCGYVPLTRWVESGTTCVDYSKYVNNVEQISYDNGQTWVNTSNTSASTLVEQYPYECLNGVKLLSVSNYGNVSATPCNSTAALISSDVPYFDDSSSEQYTTYIVGECVTAINGSWGGSGTGGLYGKTHMVECRIPNTVTSIGYGSFSGCTSLSSLTIPSGVTYIASAMCYGCSSMESVTLPNSITRIRERAFQGCSSLRGLVIPDSVTELENYCFSGCTSLTSVTIGSGVTAIGGSDFEDCTSLSSITIPNNVTDIKSGAFKGCTSLTSVNIPNNVASISGHAFYGCTSLTSATIGSGVEIIGEEAFRYCSGLTSIDIPDSVTSIGSWAFVSCTGLTSIMIGSGTTSIGRDAFKYCTSLTSITVNAVTPPTLDLTDAPFDSTNNCPIYVPCLSVNTYKSASVWSQYSSRIQGIPPCSEPLAYKFLLTYFNGATYSAGCSSMTDTLTSGETRASGSITLIKSADVGDCVTTIGENAFSGFTNIADITIPSSVTRINDKAFYNCKKLDSITIEATTPPTLSSTNALTYTNSCPIYVPADSVNAYKAAFGWISYASRIQAIPT